ncbi:MAG TPA: MBL fold metallo-hydrolase [Nitriliruptoraceae bacterium]|nr:MBL fold metallo-hydrolase [Nitriliruptoraceae bacterium]
MMTYTAQLLGTATVLLEYGDLTMLTDPALDPGGGSYDLGFVTIDKTRDPHRGPAQLPPVDVVLLSHDQHADNLDEAGRALLEEVPLVLTTTEGAERLGSNAVGLEPWSTHRVGAVTITAVPARHGPAEAVPVVGPVVGFVVTSPNGPTVYVSGDTVPHDGTDEIVERYGGAVDYALLHAGSVAQPGDDGLTFFTMTAAEAADLAERLAATAVSIIHADSWSHFRELMPDALSVVDSSPVGPRLVDLSDGRARDYVSPPGA